MFCERPSIFVKVDGLFYAAQIFKKIFVRWLRIGLSHRLPPERRSRQAPERRWTLCPILSQQLETRIHIHQVHSCMPAKSRSRTGGCAMTPKKRASDKTSCKGRIAPVRAMTAYRANDTSVIRGPAIKKAGR